MSFPKSKSTRVCLILLGLLLPAGILVLKFWDDLPFIHDAPQRPATATLKPGQIPSPVVVSPATEKPVANDLPQPPTPDPARAEKQPAIAAPAPSAPTADGDLVKAPQEKLTKPVPPAPVASAAPAPAPLTAPAADPSGEYLQAPGGDLRALTKLLADLEEIKVRVAIQEQIERMKKLKEPAAPSLPQLILPPAAHQQPVPDANLPLPPKPRLRVVSIQGIDGNVTASLETPSGVRTVKVGDRFGSGRVDRISGAGVVVRDGRNTQLLPVEE